MQEERGERETDGRPPHPGELLGLLGTVLTVSAAARLLAGPPFVSNATGWAVTAFAAGAFGVPALVFLLERGRLRLGPMLTVGAVAGAILPVLLTGSSMVGLLVRSGAVTFRRFLAVGVPIPYAILTWREFFSFLGWSVAIGVLSALIYWLATSGGLRKPRTWALVLLAFAAAALAGYIFGA